MTEINTIPHIDAHEITHNDDSLTLPEVLSEEDRARLWSLNNEVICVALLTTQPDTPYKPGDICTEIKKIQSNAVVGKAVVPLEYMRRMLTQKLVPLGLFEMSRGEDGHQYFTKTAVAEEFATPFAIHLLGLSMQTEKPLRDLLGYPRPPEADLLGGYPQLIRLRILHVLADQREYTIAGLCEALNETFDSDVSKSISTHVSTLIQLGMIDEIMPESGRRNRNLHPTFKFKEGLEPDFEMPPVSTLQHRDIPGAVSMILRRALTKGDARPFKPIDLIERNQALFDALAPGNPEARRAGVATVLDAAHEAGILELEKPARERFHKGKINSRGLILNELMQAIDERFTKLDPTAFTLSSDIRADIIDPDTPTNPALLRAIRRGLPRKRT